ncbi:MAG TPA: pyruvate flavodoxin/ferredoxin oxidoreductase [Candidatus Bathyarchaeia archaeon]|nr:pyruvate flavodoxin/ferredoxin oxidoreductase [Candidatus Bathyarchaeia archaeon]
MREFVDGARAIARGAIAAGCNFFAGYPITPASPILNHMFRELPTHGAVAIQGEDEIASLGMCIGAAMAGARCMTATSGPGMSLYSENIGLAIMGEVPLVIVNVMRLGPATGGATTVGQGDVQFVRWSTSGGYPIIALCPTNPVECYSLTVRSFQLAERFRSPVFLLTDREVVATMSTVDVVNNNPTILAQRVSRTGPDDERFMSYRIHDLSDVPFFSAYGGKNLLRFTGSTHDEEGFLTKDPKKVEKLNRHLAAKIEAHFDEIETVSADLQDEARTLLVGYGITARSILEATRTIRENGKKVSSLIINSLWPVPEAAIKRALRGIDRVLVAELNLGQYRLELERVTGGIDHRTEVLGINRVDGELISPQQILEATL